MGVTDHYNWPTPDDSDPVSQGAFAIRELAAAIDDDMNARHGAWQGYTPNLINVTLGSGGVVSGRYHYSPAEGKVTATAFVQLGTGGSVNGTLQVGLPVTGVVSGENRQVGSAVLEDGRFWPCACRLTSDGDHVTVIHAEAGAGGVSNAGNPFTFAAGDRIQVSITYEVPPV